MDKLLLIGLLIEIIPLLTATEPTAKVSEQSERSGRAWHHALPNAQTLQQHQQNQAPVFLQTSTNQPVESSGQQLDPNGSSRNFEEQDKAMPSASEQDFMSRHYGFFNIHRFDPSYPYYDRAPYPRYPSPHMPRFGPGYRKDKYGHGYGYSCKQGDDCDEVRAANQIPAVPPPLPSHGPHHHHPSPFGSHYPDLPPLPSLPSFPNIPSFGPYPGSFPHPPARFNDPHAPLPPQMPPSRFYHARYLHEQDEGKKEEVDPKTE
ncbi:putative uncharacterized protein DDB_G0291608 [Uloborus diversus]|uniref:putative uncharacterized protein DDB_G0291608 n=1 Tax=Uloborus diversus TaxID=327109 RepID=UPI002409E4C8|nr:putative uncharacterized protein DDB_G0291608 [Uloborus diversus]